MLLTRDEDDLLYGSHDDYDVKRARVNSSLEVAVMKSRSHVVEPMSFLYYIQRILYPYHCLLMVG